MTTDERQRIARVYRDLAAKFRNAAGDEPRTREAAAIAARLFVHARGFVPALRNMGEGIEDVLPVQWSTNARAEERCVGWWRGIVQAIAVHHPERLPPVMPGADHYATACEILADHAEDALPGDPHTGTKRRKGVWLGEALLKLRDHPEWPDAAIARHIGVHPSTLCRNPDYRLAAKLARDCGSPACGRIVVDDEGRHNVEAWDEDDGR